MPLRRSRLDQPAEHCAGVIQLKKPPRSLLLFPVCLSVLLSLGRVLFFTSFYLLFFSFCLLPDTNGDDIYDRQVTADMSSFSSADIELVGRKDRSQQKSFIDY